MSFEERGIELQRNAYKPSYASRAFEYSCKLCSERGVKLDCDRCGIRAAHECAMEFFKDQCDPGLFKYKLVAGNDDKKNQAVFIFSTLDGASSMLEKCFAKYANVSIEKIALE